MIRSPAALVPFVCVGCGKHTRQRPVFHPSDPTRIFPSICVDCVADVPWHAFPASELAPEMSVAAMRADDASIATANIEVAYEEFCQSRGSRPFAGVTS